MQEHLNIDRVFDFRRARGNPRNPRKCFARCWGASEICSTVTSLQQSWCFLWRRTFGVYCIGMSCL